MNYTTENDVVQMLLELMGDGPEVTRIFAYNDSRVTIDFDDGTSFELTIKEIKEDK